MKKIKRVIAIMMCVFTGMILTSLLWEPSDNWKWQLVVLLSLISIHSLSNET